MQYADQMQRVISSVLEGHNLTADFVKSEHFYAKIENEPYTPLIIVRHGPMIAVAHYKEQKDDLIPDPDVEFYVNSEGRWLPAAIQHSTGHYSRPVVKENGQTFIKKAAYEDLRELTDLWARNIDHQGFAKGKVVSLNFDRGKEPELDD
jgi:hypothetical protein